MIIRDEHIKYAVILGPINYDIYEDLSLQRVSIYVPPLADIIIDNPKINEVRKEKDGALIMSDTLLYRLLKSGNREAVRMLYVGHEFLSTHTVEFKEVRNVRDKLTSPQFFIKEMVRLEKLFENASIPEKVNILAETNSLSDIVYNRDMQSFNLKELDGIVENELTVKFQALINTIKDKVVVSNELLPRSDFLGITRQQILK